MGGFYDTVLVPKGWSVRTGGQMNWQVESPTAGIGQILPNMKTDIVLESPDGRNDPEGYRLVIDTNSPVSWERASSATQP